MNSAIVLLSLSLLLGVQCADKNVYWEKIDEHPGSSEVKSIWISLKQKNLDKLEQKFWEVSNPTSPSYGHYLKKEEIKSLIAPSDNEIEKVISWLNSYNVYSIDLVTTSDAMNVKLTIEQIETIFGVKMNKFRSKVPSSNGQRRTITRSSIPYKVPASIRPYIDLVHGINDFPLPTTKKQMVEYFTELHFQNAVKNVKTTGGAPIIGAALSRGGDSIEVIYTPMCMNNQPTTDAKQPCSDNPPVLTKVQVTSIPITDNFPNTTATVTPMCQLINGNVTCFATVPATYYVPVNLSMTSFFGNTAGTPSQYGFSVVSTPPVVPSTLNQLYSIPQHTMVTNSTVNQCVVEFEQQYYSPSDLKLFFEEMGLPQDTPVTVIGPNDASNPGGEANLDIQWIMALAPKAPTVFWSIYANSTIEIDDILQWAYAIGNTTNPPLVSSLSYGMSEDNVDTYLGVGYIARSDTEFQKLALMGLTIIIADGDSGAGDLGPLPMGNTNCKVLHPDWPSQSPYITAVGSTYITPWTDPICYLPPSQGGINCQNNPLGEVAVSMTNGLFWTTGGGFSNLQVQPPYQAQFVSQYLTHKDAIPPAGVFNPAGRAYPDVVAVGHNLMVALNGTFIPVDGTSASAPIFAGIVTLLNNVRANAGRPPLGFLNPLLYHLAASVPEAFYDVTVGDNQCGTIDFIPSCCLWGFHAVPGWDAVTGLGSPNYEVLSKAVLKY